MTCSECGNEMGVAPSWAMQSGLNSGHGSCLECKTFLHLWIDGDEIKSEPFETYKVRMLGEK